MGDREDSMQTDGGGAGSSTAGAIAAARGGRGGSKAGARGGAAGRSSSSKDGGPSGGAGGASSSAGGPTFPLTRVSRIVKADSDIETTSKDAIWTIAMATVGVAAGNPYEPHAHADVLISVALTQEYFIKHLTDSALAKARLDGKRTLTYKELANAVESQSEFFFLNGVCRLLIEGFQATREALAALQNATDAPSRCLGAFADVIPQPIPAEEAFKLRRELEAHRRARQVGLVDDDFEDSDEEEEEEEAVEEEEEAGAADGNGKTKKASKSKASKKAAAAAAAAGADESGADSKEKAPRKSKGAAAKTDVAQQADTSWGEGRPLKANGQPRLKPGPKPKVRAPDTDGGQDTGDTSAAPASSGSKAKGRKSAVDSDAAPAAAAAAAPSKKGGTKGKQPSTGHTDKRAQDTEMNEDNASANDEADELELDV